MGAFLDKPKTDKQNEHGAGNGLHYGVASMQGWRMEMEDAHRALTGLGTDLKDWSFFAVSLKHYVHFLIQNFFFLNYLLIFPGI